MRSISNRTEGIDAMEQRTFGHLGRVSALTLGGGGIAGNWGVTNHDEAVATIREAVDSGITLIDVAPTYGQGEAERAIGDALDGRLPTGVRIATKIGINGDPAPDRVPGMLDESLAASLARMRIERIDILFLHSQIIPDDKVGNYHGTPRHLFVEMVRPVFEQLVADGRIGAWGLTAIGVPSIMLETFGENPPPAAVQCIANVLDSPGDLLRFEEPPRPRHLIAAADSRAIAVMGIRAVQAGALTDSLDRELPDDHPCVVDFRRAKSFRSLAREVGESSASLAHRYAFSMAGLSTVVLGVKNRTELRESIVAESKGPLDADLVARIDSAIAEP